MSVKSIYYIEKLGFAGVHLIFIFLIQNIHCGYLCTHDVCFERKFKKNQNISNEIFNFSFRKTDI